MINELIWCDFDEDVNVKPNKKISNNLLTLQKHYTLMLKYIEELEQKNNILKRNVRYNEHRVQELENMINTEIGDTYFQKKLNDAHNEIKKILCSKASYKAQYLKEKRKREESELLLKESLDCNVRLQQFQTLVLKVLTDKKEK